MFQDQRKIIRFSPHAETCLADMTQNVVDHSINEAIQEAAEGIEPAPRAYNKFLVNMRNKGLDHASIKPIPNFCNKKSGIYRKRNKVAKVAKICSKEFADVEVPNQFSDFILADYFDGEIRILIFCSKEARNHMQNIKNYYMDGTFKSSPTPFLQLYTIQGELQTDENSDGINIVPLIYAFMSHKTKKSYAILFSLVKSQIPQWTPNAIRIDFEEATINALREMQIDVKGCYFHFTKSLKRKAKQLNLNMPKVRLHRRIIQLCCVLPHLPENLINAGWEYVQTQFPNNPVVNKFRKYFSNHWMKPNMVKMWSVFSDRYRTTNSVEGWNHKINALLNKNPNVLQVLHVLLKDATLTNFRCDQIQRFNVKLPKRRQCDIEKDVFINSTQMQLTDGKISIPLFIEKIAMYINC